jgi:hypothetical protein
MSKVSLKERLRRLRLGNIKRLLRDRYGPTLPDDDAGRDDLHELLLPVSLGKSPAKVMANFIGNWAPWMSETEAAELIQHIERTPTPLRHRTAKDLGQRLNVTNAERERLALWTIFPANMTDAQMAEWRNLKRNRRRAQRRRWAGTRGCTTYVATSLSKQKPWQLEGISRRTWYRRRKMAQPVAQVVAQVNSYKWRDQTCATEQDATQQGLARRARVREVKGANGTWHVWESRQGTGTGAPDREAQPGIKSYAVKARKKRPRAKNRA